MRAETVSVGTEILLGQIADTNAVELGRVFAECGIAHTHRQTVGDNLERLTDSLRLALSRADIVVTIGGLGPTDDDLTRDGIAAALEDPLILDAAVESRLRSLFERRRLVWLDSQIRQAYRPSCGDVIENPNGTAPGLVCRKDGKTVIAMPGPKPEFVPMLEGPVKEILVGLGGGGVIRSRIVRIAGMGESLVEDRLRDLMKQDDPTVAPYAKIGEVHLRLTAKRTSASEADADLARENFHMTSQRVARLASEAGAGQLILQHVSRRYDPASWNRLLEEARAIFPAARFPAAWSAAKRRKRRARE